MSLLQKTARAVTLVAFAISLTCVTVMLAMAALSPIWPSLWGLLMDVPGFALAVLGWLSAALGLLVTPRGEFANRRTWVLIAALCGLAVFIYRTPDLPIPTVQLSSPLLEVLLLSGLYRLFASLRHMSVRRSLAWLVVGSMWPVSFFAVYELFGDPWASFSMLVVNGVLFNLMAPALESFLRQLSIYRDHPFMGPVVVAVAPSVVLFGVLPAICFYMLELATNRR